MLRVFFSSYFSSSTFESSSFFCSGWKNWVFAGAQFHAVTGSSSGLKISLVAELEADVVGVDPGAGPELDPGPEVTPEVSEPAGERLDDVGLASEDLTDQEVEYCEAALASRLILLFAFLSSMILRSCSTLLLVSCCSSSGVDGWCWWHPENIAAEGSKPGRKRFLLGSELPLGLAPTPGKEWTVNVNFNF